MAEEATTPEHTGLAGAGSSVQLLWLEPETRLLIAWRDGGGARRLESGGGLQWSMCQKKNQELLLSITHRDKEKDPPGGTRTLYY